jgi:hypothetical protein
VEGSKFFAPVPGAMFGCCAGTVRNVKKKMTGNDNLTYIINHYLSSFIHP